MKQKLEENDLETIYIKDEISKCEGIEELKERIFPMIRTQQEQWTEKINQIITESGLTKSKFAEVCGVSRVSVNKQKCMGGWKTVKREYSGYKAAFSNSEP